MSKDRAQLAKADKELFLLPDPLTAEVAPISIADHGGMGKNVPARGLHSAHGILGRRVIAYAFESICQLLPDLQDGLHDMLWLLPDRADIKRTLVFESCNHIAYHRAFRFRSLEADPKAEG